MRVNIRGRVLSLPTGAYTRLGGQTRTFPKWKEPLQGLSHCDKPSQPKVEPHNFRGVTKMVGLTVAAFGNVYLINIFLLRSPRPPPCVTLLSDMEWGNWSDSEIARKTLVSRQYVNKLRHLSNESLSYNNGKITPDNPEVTLRSFFGTFVPKFGTRPS